jgi:hypothetical protein
MEFRSNGVIPCKEVKLSPPFGALIKSIAYPWEIGGSRTGEKEMDRICLVVGTFLWITYEESDEVG